MTFLPKTWVSLAILITHDAKLSKASFDMINYHMGHNSAFTDSYITCIVWKLRETFKDAKFPSEIVTKN